MSTLASSIIAAAEVSKDSGAYATAQLIVGAVVSAVVVGILFAASKLRRRR